MVKTSVGGSRDGRNVKLSASAEGRYKIGTVYSSFDELIAALDAKIEKVHGRKKQ